MLLRIFQGDAYAAHKLIWKLFPGDPGSKRTFLFRQEYEKEQLSSGDSRRGLPIYYVLSEKHPKPIDGLITVETKPYEPKLTTSLRLCFDLRANPVVARTVHGKKNSAKHDVLMDAKKQAKQQKTANASAIKSAMNQAAIDWLNSRSAKHGFHLICPPLVEVSGYQQHYLKKRSGLGITFSSIELAGSLEVTDPDSFKMLLLNGIGSARSFGCGMMMIRPA